MSCIHYKFKSSLDYNSVTFDGLHLSLGDLKKAISAQKRLKPGEFDLEITNAQTGDVYKKLDELIAKNTSVIVSRVPVTKTTASSTQKSWEAFKQECAKVVRVKLKEKERQMTLEKMKQTPDLAVPQASEIDKIKAVIDMSTKGFEPPSLPGRHPSAVPSDSYVCKRCGKKGHFISYCPNLKSEDRVIEPRVKRTTGIPSTMLTIVDDPLHPGALLTSQGQFAVPTIDVEAYKESKKERPPFLPGETQAEPEKKKIPQELLCHICEDLCVDAAIAPCCGTSFCDECLREELLESEDHQCPSCHETNVSPDRIVANRSMRIAVTNFLNDTGYTKVKRRRSSSAGGDSTTSQEAQGSVQGLSASRPVVDANSLGNSSTNITRINSIIPSATISSTVPLSTGESIQSIYSAKYPPLPAHVPPRYGAHNQNANYHPNYPSSQGYSSKHWPRPRTHYGNQSYQGNTPRSDNYKPVEKRSWNIAPPIMSSTLAPTSVPDVAAVASQAVQAVQAALLTQGHVIARVPPPSHLPYTGLTGYPPSYVRPEMVQASVVQRPVPFATPVEHPKPLSKEEFYETQKRMQSSALPSKPPDIFDSFADLTQMRSPTPELRSRSTSPTGTPPKKKSHSRSNSPLSRHSLSRGSSPRRLHTRSRSLSRPRSMIRSRSRSRTRSQLPSRSPSHRSRSQNRSRTRSPVQSRLSKVRSSSKSPIRRSKLRSRSPSKGRFSKPRSRSLSPLLPLRRSPKSPPPLRRSSKSPLPLRRSSKSPPPLRSRSRSRSFKRSIRTRSRSWSRPKRSRSRSYSPLQRSPRRTPRKSPRSSLSPRRSYSPKRRSRSFSPRKKSPYRSRTRSPLPPKRYSRSGSRSPRPLRRSYSPIRSQRSKSPYRKPLSPLPLRRRSPSPFYSGGRGGGFRGRGRGRGGFNRDGFRGDRDRQRHYPSPPKHVGPNAAPNRSLPDATLNYPPVPYLPGMGIPPPEEFFKYNPAGYEEFVRKIYAQLGPQAHAWNPQQVNLPPPPQVNSYPPTQSPMQPGNRPPWQPVHLPPNQRPHSLTPPGPPGNRSPPKHGDFNYRDGNRPFLNERDREEMGRDRHESERRFDDRDRRADSRERRMHFKDRRFDPRDRRMDDRERRVEDRDRVFEERDRKAEDKEKRGDKDRGRGMERRREKGDSERHKDREHEKAKDRDYEKARDKDKERIKDKDYEKAKERDYEKSKDKDSSRAGDKSSSDKKKTPPRKSSKEADKSKSKERKKVDKNRDGKEKVKNKSKTEKDENKETDTVKDNHLEEKKQLVVKKETVEFDNKSDMQLKSLHKGDENENKAVETQVMTEKPQEDAIAVQPESGPTDVKEKKSIGKKKGGALGLKKGKSKDSISESTATVEKKVKKIKKKKLTFGSSDADNKQGLKKKKLKRLVDYKSENNNMSEDGEHDKAHHGVSPLKKAKVDEANEIDQVSKTEAGMDVSKPDIKQDRDLAGVKDAGSSPHQPTDDATDSKEMEEIPEKVKSELIPELPELSKWERDDFDLLDTLEAPKEKPKEKLMVPRSIVDKAEKFLSQKPMKNSVIAPVQSANIKSDDETAPPRHRTSRSKSPVSKPVRRVYMDSRRDLKDKKSLDHIQITVRGDKRKNEPSNKKIPLNSSKSSEDSYRRSSYHSKEIAYEEDERSVVKSSSLEREMIDNRSSPVHRNKRGGSKQEKSSRDKGVRHDYSRKDQEKHRHKSRDISPPSRQEDRGRRPSKDEKGSSGSYSKSSKDLHVRIEEKTRAKSNNESRKMSVMDESEFVPDYEDLGPDTASENENTPQMSGASSHDEKESRKRKSEEKDDDDDDSGSGKHKKAKKKHKHKEKKEKKEKHKHKKKKHKQKKSKERDNQE